MQLGLGMKAKVHKQPGEDNPNSLYFIWYLRYNSVNLIIEIKFHVKFLTFKFGLLYTYSRMAKSWRILVPRESENIM